MALVASFVGKRILITGGANGLGRNLVERLTRDKAIVYALDKSETDLKKLKMEFPSVETLAVDLGNWDATKEVVSSIGHVDHLVNNAGFMDLIPFLDIKQQDFRKVMDINLGPVIQVSQIVAKNMVEKKSGGSIVNVASVAIASAAKHYALYAASKAGVENVTKTMAVELAPHSIRVNCISPGPMDTALINQTRQGYLEPKSGFIVTRSTIRRLVVTDEAADLILFLLSPLSKMINGENVFIDGGIHIT